MFWLCWQLCSNSVFRTDHTPCCHIVYCVERLLITYYVVCCAYRIEHSTKYRKIKQLKWKQQTEHTHTHTTGKWHFHAIKRISAQNANEFLIRESIVGKNWRMPLLDRPLAYRDSMTFRAIRPSHWTLGNRQRTTIATSTVHSWLAN